MSQETNPNYKNNQFSQQSQYGKLQSDQIGATVYQNQSLFYTNQDHTVNNNQVEEFQSQHYGSRGQMRWDDGGNPTAQNVANQSSHNLVESDNIAEFNIGSSNTGASTFMQNTGVSEQEKQDIIKHIDELKYAEKRDNALLELSRQREHFSELAPFIWHSVGTIAALLQEIVSVYPLLSPPLLDSKTSNKACNVLALLQCVASHKDTRPLFLKAHITLFLYPFLNTVSKGRSFEYLRLTSLGVVGALVKVDDPDVISFLLQTEIIPLCLRIMERGTDLSQTVATFIIQKILLDENGLTYLCMTAERFFAVSTVLNNMVESQLLKPSTRLLKHIIKCYFRLSENPRAQMALNTTMPTIVKEMMNNNSKLTENLDDSSKKLLMSLIETLRFRNNNGFPQNGSLTPMDYNNNNINDNNNLGDETDQLRHENSEQYLHQQMHQNIHVNNQMAMQQQQNFMMQNHNRSVPFQSSGSLQQRQQTHQNQQNRGNGELAGSSSPPIFSMAQGSNPNHITNAYLFSNQGGAVTSPRLTSQTPTGQLNYIPQHPGNNNRQSPTPSQQQQFLSQAPHYSPPHTNTSPQHLQGNFPTMLPQFTYQMPPQSFQTNQNNSNHTQQRQTSPGMEVLGVGQNELHTRNFQFYNMGFQKPQ